jgi:hypothetical protein
MSKAQGIANSANQGQFKNRLINSDMRIDQRNAGAVYSSLNGYSLDRWFVDNNTNTVGLTTQQSSVAPSGFVNSLIHTITGTGASPASGNRNRFGQRIEGFNAADLMWGAANAQAVTLSFWVRSSLTGTFSGGFGNNSANRSYVFTYVVNSANTWEYKTITIAGDTTGTWTTNNSAGIAINFDIGSGSNFVGTAGAWSAGDFFKSSGSVSLVSNSGATFYITGVQLEKGSTATSFDYRPYGTELALCQRYYEVVQGGHGGQFSSGTYYIAVTGFKVQKRSDPTVTRLSDVIAYVVNTPYAERITSVGFSSVAQANTSTGGQWSTLYSASSEL